MLKLDDHESVDGHSGGALRSLELDQPTYVGGVPYGSTEHSQLVNRTALMHLLGVQKLVGLDGCIKRFKLGHREVKIQSASEPLALRRISLNECQEGTLHTATVRLDDTVCSPIKSTDQPCSLSQRPPTLGSRIIKNSACMCMCNCLDTGLSMKL